MDMTLAFAQHVSGHRYYAPSPFILHARMLRVSRVNRGEDGVVQLWYTPPGGSSACVWSRRAQVGDSMLVDFILSPHGEAWNTFGGDLVLSGVRMVCPHCAGHDHLGSPPPPYSPPGDDRSSSDSADDSSSVGLPPSSSTEECWD